MWGVIGNNLQMAEGDFGLTLPITIGGTELSSADTIRLTIKAVKDGEAIIERDMIPTDNTVNFTITAAETSDLPAGVYVYSLDWYQNGHFMCNIIPVGVFKVVDKA